MLLSKVPLLCYSNIISNLHGNLHRTTSAENGWSTVCQKNIKNMKHTKKKHNSKDLIPFEKSRRVIYLEERGRQKKKPKVGSILLAIIGLLCITYCIGIGLAGFGSLFFLTWGVIGIICILAALLLSSKVLMDAIPGWLKGIITGIICAGLVLFFAVEGMILSQYNAVAAPGADYCIILGTQLKTDGPSEVLRRRLDRAIEYLNQNVDTKVIVSGGQGRNEPAPEAVGMKEYLVNAGIAEDRILLESLSGNTYENLTFSKSLIGSDDARVVIVTNNFHVFRALKIAEKQGYQNVEGLAASAITGHLPNNLLREFVGVVKDFLFGNL